jgi:hypothetical protein
MIPRILLGAGVVCCTSGAPARAPGEHGRCAPTVDEGARATVVSLPVRALRVTPPGVFSVALGDSLALAARDPAAWSAAWSAAGASAPLPALDFTREFGVLVATGNHGSGDARITIDSVYRLAAAREAVVVFHVRPSQVAPDTMSRAAAAVAVQCSPQTIGAIRFRGRDVGH